MTHEKKKTMARRLMSKRETKEHRPIFLTNSWIARKIAIEARVAKEENIAHERAEKKRKDAL